MPYYVNRDGQGYTETVEECGAYRDARELAIEYRIADPSACYYVSQRACFAWFAGESRDILRSCGVTMEGGHWPDFHALPSRIVDELKRYADQERYKKPHSANGSRLRYYYQRLVRRATADR